VLDNQFIQEFSEHIKFSYSFFDRVIVRGYILKLFRPASVIALLRNLGFSNHSNGVFKLFSDQLNSHIKKVALKNNIPLLWRENYGGKDLEMQSFVEENYYRKDKFGAICIIKSLEFMGCFWNKQVNTKSGKFHTNMYWCKKQVTQHYIYFNDKTLGLCCLKISSGFPFHCQFYFNGHYYLRRQFDKRGVKYKMDDNAFTELGDIQLLQELVKEFKGSTIEKIIRSLMQAWFRFDKGERSTCSSLLQHNWYTSQCEVCSNVVFKNKGYFDRMYDKIIEKHHNLGVPDRLSQLFELKRERKQSKSTQKVYYQKACVRHWIQGNSIKMYNKGGYMLRVETTINNPRLPGAKLQKPLFEIKGYYWYSFGCNNRFFDAISSIDSSQIGSSENELTSAVYTKKGKRVAAPDLRNPKQIALLAVLCNPRFSVEWFRTKELIRYLSGHYSKTAEIRYQMDKLKARNLIERRKGANYYRVTKKGYAWINIAYSQNRYFLTPLLSMDIEKGISKECEGLDKFELTLNTIKNGLDAIYQELNIAA
jgi:hypothetical protein